MQQPRAEQSGDSPIATPVRRDSWKTKQQGAFLELKKRTTNIMEDPKCHANKLGTLGVLAETQKYILFFKFSL